MAALDYAVWMVDSEGVSTLLGEFAAEESALGFAEQCADRDRENRHEGTEYQVFVCQHHRIYSTYHEGGEVLCG